MTKPLHQRVPDAFSPEDREDILVYLDALREAWRDHASGARRAVTLGLVLAVVSELLSYSAVREFDLGPLVISQASTLRAFVPTAVAFLFLETTILTRRVVTISKTHAQLVGLWRAGIEKNDLETLLAPRMPIFWPAGTRPMLNIGTKYEKWEWRVFGVLAGLAMLAPYGFVGRALWVLLDDVGVGSVLWWGNALASAVLLAYTTVLIVIDD